MSCLSVFRLIMRPYSNSDCVLLFLSQLQRLTDRLADYFAVVGVSETLEPLDESCAVFSDRPAGSPVSTAPRPSFSSLSLLFRCLCCESLVDVSFEVLSNVLYVSCLMGYGYVSGLMSLCVSVCASVSVCVSLCLCPCLEV